MTASGALHIVSHHESPHDSSKGYQTVHQLTVRGFDPALADSIRRLARQERISLNQAALRLLRRGAGLADDQGSVDTVGSSLDHFIGSWTREQADEMDRALEDFEGIDESMWS